MCILHIHFSYISIKKNACLDNSLLTYVSHVQKYYDFLYLQNSIWLKLSTLFLINNELHDIFHKRILRCLIKIILQRLQQQFY